MKLVIALSTLVACAGAHHDQAAGDASGGAAGDASIATDADASLDATTPLDAAAVTDPFDPASCASPPITQAQLAAKFAQGASETTLGTYAFSAERRSCNPQTGCTAWSAITAKIQLEDPQYTIFIGSAGTITADAGAWFTFGFQFDTGTQLGSFGDNCDVAKPIDVSPNISGCGTWELRPDDDGSEYMVPAWTGILANDCARLSASTGSGDEQYQWAILATF
jgi:hypothetical protein